MKKNSTKDVISRFSAADQFSYSRWPLWLLEYAVLSDSKGQRVEGLQGPFLMHCIYYLTAISAVGGVQRAVDEFADQLSDRLCEMDTGSYKGDVAEAKKAARYLIDLLVQGAGSASVFDRNRARLKELIAAIQKRLLADIKAAYSPEDYDEGD